MKFTAQQQEKLELAKALLTALGLPKAQGHDRSGWVFLALANINLSQPVPARSYPLPKPRLFCYYQGRKRMAIAND